MDEIAIDKLVDDLLELHCKDCDGCYYGCTGCTKMKDIEEIIKKYENSIS